MTLLFLPLPEIEVSGLDFCPDVFFIRGAAFRVEVICVREEDLLPACFSGADLLTDDPLRAAVDF